MSTEIILLLGIILTSGALYVAHLIATVIATVVAWRRRIVIGILVAPAIVLLAWLAGVPMSWHLPAISGAAAAAMVWRRWTRNADRVNRWGQSGRRKAGVASAIDVFRFASAWSCRRKACIVRPSMAKLTRLQRARVPATEFAVRVAKVGIGRWVWTSRENVTLLFGAPRYGKSGTLAGQIIDAPGAVVATSTRGDLFESTCEQREKRGSVYVFNAVGLGDIPSTLMFDPLTNCKDPVAAFERATDMMSTSDEGGAGGDREWWEAQGRRVLAALMHAAALGDMTMNTVLSWVADPVGNERIIASLLRESPQPAYVQDVKQFVSTNERTRTSITSSIMPSLGWLTSPAASAAARPGATIDVEDLLRSHVTIYLIGAKETQSGPLVCALTGYLAREARRLAGFMPGGRLDPPLTFVLDEAAQLSPPLDDWTADMGGRGVTILAAYQSRSQLLDRWSPAKAGTIMNNATRIMLFGGTKEKEDLEYWTTLGGDRDEEVVTTDEHGAIKSRTVRKVPVFIPAQIANLAPATKGSPARVILFGGGMPPALGSAQMLWQRRDVRWRIARARLVRLLAWLRRHWPKRALAPVISLTKQRPVDDEAA